MMSLSSLLYTNSDRGLLPERKLRVILTRVRDIRCTKCLANTRANVIRRPLFWLWRGHIMGYELNGSRLVAVRLIYEHLSRVKPSRVLSDDPE
jgi:hypothetical protein